MNETTLSVFWQLVGWVFALNAEAFRVVSTFPQGLTLALFIVLFAGVSQAIAQSIILFVNKVQPLRFVLSLLINALLFVAGFLFLVFSTWLITLFPGSVNIGPIALISVFGVSYAPLLFSSLGALPYLGVPLLSLLSVWQLLAIVVGFDAVTEIGLNQSFGFVVLGWLVLQILQQTVGQPLANFSRWLTDTVAGVDLSTRRRDVADIVESRAQQSPSVWQEQLREQITEVRDPNNLPESTARPAATPTAPGNASASAATASQPQSRTEHPRTRIARTLKMILGFLGIVALTYIIIVFLRPVREWWFGWYRSLPTLFRFIFNLFWIGVVAIVVAGLLAPLETLGWWAGWYDDDVNTVVNAGELAEPVADPKKVFRYIVYLDGIGKSTFEYLPDIEEFLDTLAPALPEDMALIRGIMPYSVLNNPLDQDRPLSFLWKLVEKSRVANPASFLGLLINIRNVLIVGVSADQRYGPLYNQGIAQVVYNGLVKNGYPLNSSVPITLIGYSGGGQMSCACAPFLKRAVSAPIDVISLGGVISGNCNVLKLEHLYHLVGDKDDVERIGPIMFPGRWKVFFLSYWNRAKRRGKISIFSMGPVGHQVPGGILDPKLILSDGVSALEQTVDYIQKILRGELLPKIDLTAVQASNYELYRQADFNRPEYYPIDQSVNPDLYKPIGAWMGRLILPKLERRSQIGGVLFEVHHADAEHQHLVGRVVKLRWSEHPEVQKFVKAVTRDVHFSADAEYTSKYGGLVHPVRLNHWQSVGPLESLAGSHPADDVTVMLDGAVAVERGDFPTDGYVLEGLARLAGVDFVYLDPGQSPAEMPDNVTVLVRSAVHYKTAEIADIARYEAEAKETGLDIIWDLSHATGLVDLSLRDDGARFAVGCGYKFLNGGPGAPAFLYCRSDEIGRMEHPVSGWLGHQSPFAFTDGYEPAGDIRRFITSSPSILALSALDGALDAYDGLSLADVEAKARALGDLFLAAGEELGLETISPPQGARRGGHVCLKHEDGYAIVQALIARGIIGDFRAPDLMRFGFSPLYLSYEEVGEAARQMIEVITTREYQAPEFAVKKAVT